jgi:hypothetical protein
MQVFRGVATDTDITIPHEHSMTGMPRTPVLSASLPQSCCISNTVFIYSCDTMPCKRMANIVGNPCHGFGHS